MKAYFRVLKMFLHAFSAVFTGIFRYPFMDHENRRRYIQSWSQKLFRIIGIKVTITNEHLLAPYALIVSNHLSWLDIFLINTAQPSRFIAKDSIRSWPLIGWLATKAGTVYLKRNNARDLRNTFRILVTHLQGGEYFVFFPEGTSGGSQNRLLPFHSNLFEATIEAGAPVQPCVLHYVDENNQFHPSIDSEVKLPLVNNIMRVLRSDTIHAHLTILPLIESKGIHRRELAQKAHDEISATLTTHPAHKRPDNPPGITPDPQDA
ncbi:1-acyl-sn-glycerol-3-phosphate acyltransferase [Oxalobacter sp. OttesenSCG-928-P03]|nr:1-acyl-sn-glycerol-3-phosphate acyltransferase [Oxalobacter sp. OttesenSCG-928-P03]